MNPDTIILKWACLRNQRNILNILTTIGFDLFAVSILKINYTNAV